MRIPSDLFACSVVGRSGSHDALTGWTHALTVVFLAFVVIAAAKAAQQPATINVSSMGFKDGGALPKEFTADGADVSPPLSWDKPPAGTKSLALSCEDPDASRGSWWHWIIFNIPPSQTQLTRTIPHVPSFADGTTQGTNDFKKLGYNGPAPPPGKVHHYIFKLVALNSKLNLRAGSSKDEYTRAIAGHVIGSGQTTGTYSRP